MLRNSDALTVNAHIALHSTMLLTCKVAVHMGACSVSTAAFSVGRCRDWSCGCAAICSSACLKFEPFRFALDGTRAAMLILWKNYEGQKDTRLTIQTCPWHKHMRRFSTSVIQDPMPRADLTTSLLQHEIFRNQFILMTQHKYHHFFQHHTPENKQHK